MFTLFILFFHVYGFTSFSAFLIFLLFNLLYVRHLLLFFFFFSYIFALLFFMKLFSCFYFFFFCTTLFPRCSSLSYHILTRPLLLIVFIPFHSLLPFHAFFYLAVVILSLEVLSKVGRSSRTLETLN